MYPVDIFIEYNSTREYRASLRKLFSMDAKNYVDKINLIKQSEILDEETEDELAYDEESSSKIMDYVFEKTKENSGFDKLYELAAGRMFSTDRTIGLAVLFSYDYLQHFHVCLVEYFKVIPEDITTISSYNNLKKLLS